MNAKLRQSGFTLIELLAASVITAFIAMIAVAAVKSVAGGRQRVEQFTRTSDELRYAMEVIRRDLLNIYRHGDPQVRRFQGRQLTLELPDGQERPYSMLRFRSVSRTPARLGQPEGDVYEIEYFVSGNQEDPAEPLKLMRRCQPNIIDARHQGGMLAVLYEGIRSFDVVFLDAGRQEWLTSWPPDRTGLPGMLKIKITATTADGRQVVSRSAIFDFWRWPQAAPNTSGAGESGSDRPAGPTTPETNNRSGDTQNGAGASRPDTGRSGGGRPERSGPGRSRSGRGSRGSGGRGR